MIVIWPLLVVVAWLVARSRRAAPSGRGWRWSLAWIVAGFLWSFSLVTGLSIGPLLLPAAAAVLLWVAARSPHRLEALGFAAGWAVTAAVVALL